MLEGTVFYTGGNSFTESMQRVTFLKDVIEHKDGWRIFFVNGKPITQEAHLQLLYRLTWFASRMDVNREVNSGRGSVDYKISEGDADKTLVEFKLARNTKLKSNLQNQVQTYEKANDTSSSITVILYFHRWRMVASEGYLAEAENRQGQEYSLDRRTLHQQTPGVDREVAHFLPVGFREARRNAEPIMDIARRQAHIADSDRDGSSCHAMCYPFRTRSVGVRFRCRGDIRGRS